MLAGVFLVKVSFQEPLTCVMYGNPRNRECLGRDGVVVLGGECQSEELGPVVHTHEVKPGPTGMEGWKIPLRKEPMI